MRTHSHACMPINILGQIFRELHHPRRRLRLLQYRHRPVKSPTKTMINRSFLDKVVPSRSEFDGPSTRLASQDGWITAVSMTGIVDFSPSFHDYNGEKKVESLQKEDESPISFMAIRNPAKNRICTARSLRFFGFLQFSNEKRMNNPSSAGFLPWCNNWGLIFGTREETGARIL